MYTAAISFGLASVLLLILFSIRASCWHLLQSASRPCKLPCTCLDRYKERKREKLSFLTSSHWIHAPQIGFSERIESTISIHSIWHCKNYNVKSHLVSPTNLLFYRSQQLQQLWALYWQPEQLPTLTISTRPPTPSLWLPGCHTSSTP